MTEKNRTADYSLANLPERIDLDAIKAKCDSLWQQRAAVRSPAEGGPVPQPVAPMRQYQYPVTK